MPLRLRRILRVLACLILDLPWPLHALDGIYIKPVNHTGPMIEGSKYELQCEIVNVASVESLTVKWYKREKEVHNETFNNITKTPVTKTSKLQITPNKADNGTQYRCEAELNVSPLTSESLTIEVYYKPVINKTKLPSDVPIFRGYPVVLSCEAEGNPPPDISWKINYNVPVKGGTLNITEAASKKIVCIANNSVGTDTRKVNVDLKEDYLPLIAGLVAITVAVISVIFIFIYSIYYKTAKMGHYSLKDTKLCVQNGNIAQNG